VYKKYQKDMSLDAKHVHIIDVQTREEPYHSGDDSADDPDDGPDLVDHEYELPEHRKNGRIVPDQQFNPLLPALDSEIKEFMTLWAMSWSLDRSTYKLAYSTRQNHARHLRTFVKFFLLEAKWCQEQKVVGGTTGLDMSQLTTAEIRLLAQFNYYTTTSSIYKKSNNVTKTTYDDVRKIYHKYATSLTGAHLQQESTTILLILQHPRVKELLTHFVEKTTRIHRVLPATIMATFMTLLDHIIPKYQWNIHPRQLILLKYWLQNLIKHCKFMPVKTPYASRV
jgi:hypothetical protein